MTAARRAAPQPLTGITGALRRHRIMVVSLTVIYLLIYLWSIGDIVITTGRSRFAAIPSVQVAADWPSKLLRQTAPFSYEPVLAAYPASHIELLLAPVNVALGLLLGGLAGANLATAVHLYRTATTCRRRSFTGLAGALLGFLTGFACCAPTLTPLLGAQFAVAIIGLRNWLFPIALTILLASLAWNTWHLAQPRPIDPGISAVMRSREERRAPSADVKRRGR